MILDDEDSFPQRSRPAVKRLHQTAAVGLHPELVYSCGLGRHSEWGQLLLDIPSITVFPWVSDAETVRFRHARVRGRYNIVLKEKESEGCKIQTAGCFAQRV